MRSLYCSSQSCRMKRCLCLRRLNLYRVKKDCSSCFLRSDAKAQHASPGKTEVFDKRNKFESHPLLSRCQRYQIAACCDTPLPLVWVRQGAKQTRLLLSTPYTCLLMPPGQGAAILRSCQSNTSASVHRPRVRKRYRGNARERLRCRGTERGWD